MRNCRIPSSWLIKCVCVCVCVWTVWRFFIHLEIYHALQKNKTSPHPTETLRKWTPLGLLWKIHRILQKNSPTHGFLWGFFEVSFGHLPHTEKLYIPVVFFGNSLSGNVHKFTTVWHWHRQAHAYSYEQHRCAGRDVGRGISRTLLDMRLESLVSSFNPSLWKLLHHRSPAVFLYSSASSQKGLKMG